MGGRKTGGTLTRVAEGGTYLTCSARDSFLVTKIPVILRKLGFLGNSFFPKESLAEHKLAR